MIKEKPEILLSEEEEATKKLKAISEAKEREDALELLVKQINESVSEDELEKFIEKIREYRQSKPAD